MTTDTTLGTPLSTRLAALLPLLACPRCGGILQMAESQTLQCGACAAVYPVRGGVPVLLPESMQEPGVGNVSADDPVSRHPYSPTALEIIEKHTDGWVLDLGAGGKHQRWDNVVQIDIFRFPMTDVVCTADRLPFRDNAFKAVISQAVFEHLQYPEWAAAEIRRVLQPGGIVKIDTAFLQPEHGYPHHFYNATETGLRHWFRDFDIQWSGIESYQHPKWSLSWFLGIYLDRLEPAQRIYLQQTSLGDVLAALLRSGQGQAHPEDAAILAALDALPAHELRTLAAGVSVAAINPPKANSSLTSMVDEAGSNTGHDDLRKWLAAKEENAQLHQRLAAMQEQYVLFEDRSRYLAQFYPQNTLESVNRLSRRMEISWSKRLRFRVGAMLRLVVSQQVWEFLRGRSVPFRSPAETIKIATTALEPAFLSVRLVPTNTAALIDTFFSLVRQSYSSWELILLETPDQSMAVRHAMTQFQRLDQRVRIVPLASTQPQSPPAQPARYQLDLPEGTTFAFLAIQNLVTLVRDRPQTQVILADFEYVTDDTNVVPMRCYQLPCSDTLESLADFAIVVRAVAQNPQNAQDTPSRLPGEAIAHIPKVLFYYNKKSPIFASELSEDTKP